MTRQTPAWLAAPVAMMALVLTVVLDAAPALAARDRTPPTKPTNLRVTSMTSHNVTLAWNPSTDNSGTFSYRVWVSYGFDPHRAPDANDLQPVCGPDQYLLVLCLRRRWVRQQIAEKQHGERDDARLTPRLPPRRSFRWSA